jgi:hypothetical protein
MECLIEKLKYFADHPEVTWSGVGVTSLGVMYFIIKSLSSLLLCKNTPPLNNAPRTTITQRDEKRGNQHFKIYGFLVVAIGIAIMLILPKYAIYANKIHWMIGKFLIAALIFGVVIFIMSYSNSHLLLQKVRRLGALQGLRVLIAGRLILLFICFYLLFCAHTEFNPQLTEVACQNTLWQFFTEALNGYGRKFILVHVSGVIILCFVSITSFLALLHYFALMNLIEIEDMREAVCGTLAEITDRFSYRTWFFISAVLLILVYLGITTLSNRDLLSFPRVIYFG